MNYKTKSISKDKFLAMNESKFISDYKAPTYMSTFLNNVNGYAQATRKETVGALATVVFPEYLEQTDSPSPTDWKKYYLDNYQENYENATKKLLAKFEAVKEAVNSLSEQEIVAWLEDLMFYKTFNGLYVQDAILNDIAKSMGTTYKKSSSSDEGKGIDGYINNIAYSIKSETYKDTTRQAIETINARMVYYYYKYEPNSTTKIKSVEYYIEEADK